MKKKLGVFAGIYDSAKIGVAQSRPFDVTAITFHKIGNSILLSSCNNHLGTNYIRKITLVC